LFKEALVDGVKVEYLQTSEFVQVKLAGIKFQTLLLEEKAYRKSKKKAKKMENKENARKFFEVRKEFCDC
jgi:hypothetical protein